MCLRVKEARLRLVGTCVALVEKNNQRECRSANSSTIVRHVYNKRLSGEEAELLGELLGLVKEATQQIEVLSWVALTFGRLGVSSDVLGPGVRDDKQKFFLSQSGKTIEQILVKQRTAARRADVVAARTRHGEIEPWSVG